MFESAQEVAEMLFVFKEPLFHAGNPDVYRHLADWAKSHHCEDLARLSSQARQRVDDIEADFNRMCIGPYRLVVPPYESVWRSGGRVLNNRFSATVAYSYAQLGLTMNKNFNEMSDYVGNELEFLYCTSALCSTHRSEGLDSEAEELASMFSRFWAEHLGHWIFDFLDAIADNAQEAFWQQWTNDLRKELSEIFNDIALSSSMSGLEMPVFGPVTTQKEKVLL